MYKYGAANTLNFVKSLGITGHLNLQKENDILESLWLNVHQVIGYANDVIYQNKTYDFVLLSSFYGASHHADVKVSLILLDAEYEWPLVFTDKLKTHNPLKNGISVLRIDDEHFDKEKLILEFIEESAYHPIVKVSDPLKYQCILSTEA